MQKDFPLHFLSKLGALSARCNFLTAGDRVVFVGSNFGGLHLTD